MDKKKLITTANGHILDYKWSINKPLEVVMFKKTINFSELKSDPTLVSEMKDGEVFQIFHRGQDVKVMMTQEYFFTLMARLEKAEGISKKISYDPEKLMAEFESKVEKLNHLIGKVTKGKKVG